MNESSSSSGEHRNYYRFFYFHSWTSQEAGRAVLRVGEDIFRRKIELNRKEETTTIFRFLITLQPLLEVIKEIFFSLFRCQVTIPSTVRRRWTSSNSSDDASHNTKMIWRWGGWKVHCIYIVVRVAELAGRRLKSGRRILCRMKKKEIQVNEKSFDRKRMIKKEIIHLLLLWQGKDDGNSDVAAVNMFRCLRGEEKRKDIFVLTINQSAWRWFWNDCANGFFLSLFFDTNGRLSSAHVRELWGWKFKAFSWKFMLMWWIWLCCLSAACECEYEYIFLDKIFTCEYLCYLINSHNFLSEHSRVSFAM